MTLNIKLTDQAMINYSGTDNAITAFNVAVNNGQARLALQILTQVINGLVEKINLLENAEEKEVITPIDVKAETIKVEQKQEEKVEVEPVKTVEEKVSEIKDLEVKEEKTTKAKS